MLFSAVRRGRAAQRRRVGAAAGAKRCYGDKGLHHCRIKGWLPYASRRRVDVQLAQRAHGLARALFERCVR